MSIGSISPGTSPYQSGAASPMNQRWQDLQNLGQALQSGNLSSSQTAFATFQQNLQNSPATANGQTPFGGNGAANQDVQSIQTALQSGDVAGAQKAFTQLKTDLQAGASSHRAHGGHHHGGHSKGVSQSQSTPQTSSDSESSTDTSTSSSSSDATTSITNLLTQLIGGSVNQQV